MNRLAPITAARQTLREQTARILAAQREFEQTIAHLTPQRQAELMALRQIGIERARLRRGLR